MRRSQPMQVIVLKKPEFDQIEAVEAALWLSIESAQQVGSDYTSHYKRDTKGL